MTLTDNDIRNILTRTKTIALVGASANTSRPSHMVGQFLTDRGYRVIPVNPGLAGQTMFGETVVAELSEVAGPIDMVDIFRSSDAVPAIVDAALKLDGVQTIWMQLGVAHEEAAKKARAAGLDVVENHSPKIEIARLGL
jgi:predicted CoA-binding protein